MKRCFCLLFSCLLLLCSAKAQNWGGDEGEDIQFTYKIEYVSSAYKVFKNKDWQQAFQEIGIPVVNGLSAINAKSTPGFGIGLGLTKRMTSRADLRFIPTLVLNDRILEYQYLRPPNGIAMSEYKKERKVQAFLVELPLNIKIKSDRRKNFSPYITGGAKYSMDLYSEKRSKDNDKIAFDKSLKNKRNFLSYEAGLGLDLYFEYFKLSPEIKYSSSFNSILKQDNSAFSAPIDRLMLHNVTLSLYIQ